MRDPNPPQASGRILVTGCPRSGTRFTSKFYGRLGIQLGHEQAGNHGTVEWRHAFNEDPSFEIRVSLIRHPLKTIVSLTDLMISNYEKSPRIVTWDWIRRLGEPGGFKSLVDSKMWVEAAATWWANAYDFHYRQNYAIVRLEDLEGEPINNHLKPKALVIDKDFVWELVAPTAERFGYTKTGVRMRRGKPVLPPGPGKRL